MFSSSTSKLDAGDAKMLRFKDHPLFLATSRGALILGRISRLFARSPGDSEYKYNSCLETS